MNSSFSKALMCSVFSSALFTAIVPVSVQAHGSDRHHNGNGILTVYFTRHAEKETVTGDVTDPGNLPLPYISSLNQEGEVVYSQVANDESYVGKQLNEICGVAKCAEVLSDKGTRRAMLLADWFADRKVSFDAVYATHKIRTQQTVTPTATAAGLSVMQLPEIGTELNPEGTTASECATLEAIETARDAGLHTILIAGHSGTLYDIMGTGVEDCAAGAGLGLDTGNTVHGTGNPERFPKDMKKLDGSVANYGDLWKVKINTKGEARFIYRKLLDFTQLNDTETAR